MSEDNELILMKRFYAQLKKLNVDAQYRVLNWLQSKISYSTSNSAQSVDTYALRDCNQYVEKQKDPSN